MSLTVESVASSNLRLAPTHAAMEPLLDFDVQGGLSLNLLGKRFDFLEFSGSSAINRSYKGLRDAMDALVDQLRRPSKSKRSLSASREGIKKKKPSPTIGAMGELLLSSDGGFRWQSCSAALEGETFRCKQHGKSKEYVKEVAFSVPYTLPLLLRSKDGFPVVHHIRLVLAKGKVIDIRCPNDDDTLRWAHSLTALWVHKYEPSELAERQMIADEYIEKIKNERDLAIEKFSRLTQQNWRDARTPFPVIRAGAVEVTDVRHGIHEECFASLYSFCFVLFESRAEEGRNLEAHKKIKWFIPLNVCHVSDAMGNDQPVFLLTAHNVQLDMRVPHVIAKRDWLASFAFVFSSKDDLLPMTMLPVPASRSHASSTTSSHDDGEHRIMVLTDTVSRHTWSLQGDGPWTIGRSRSCTVVIPHDNFVSRFHAKIEMVDGLPFIMDAGTRTGIKVNDRFTAMEELHMNDKVLIGRTTLVFSYKLRRSSAPMMRARKKESTSLSDSSGTHSSSRHQPVPTVRSLADSLFRAILDTSETLSKSEWSDQSSSLNTSNGTSTFTDSNRSTSSRSEFSRLSKDGSAFSGMG